MSDWQKVPFESLFLVPTRNGIYKTAEFHGRGTKIVNMGELFANDRVGQQSMERVELTEQEKAAFLLQVGDLLFARRSLIESGAGKAAIVSDLPEETTFESSVIRVRLDQSKCNPLFYLYWLRSYNGRSAILPLVTGVNVKGIRGSDLAKITVDYPRIEIQNRITSIITAYDDLIETNKRQIKLLEEVVQRLYKEWFVDLRFPGHENVPVVNSVPEGWKKTTIGEMCVKTKDTIAAENIPAGTPYIGLEHIPRHDFCLSEWGDSAEVTSPKAKFKRNDIIFGQIRPYFHKVGFAITDGVASTDSFIMTPKNGVWALFLLTVFSDAFVNYSYQTCKEGAKMPRADWNQMKQYHVMIADKQTQAEFENKIQCITEEVRALSLQNRRLSEARDRLLPKLMSGEIAV